MVRAETPEKRGFLKYTLSEATTKRLRHLFDQLAADCRQTGIMVAIMHVSSTLEISRAELVAALSALAQAGCGPNFRLAWVTANRSTYEELVHTEYLSSSVGLTSRVFFDEENARFWLGV